MGVGCGGFLVVETLINKILLCAVRTVDTKMRQLQSKKNYNPNSDSTPRFTRLRYLYNRHFSDGNHFHIQAAVRLMSSNHTEVPTQSVAETRSTPGPERVARPGICAVVVA